MRYYTEGYIRPIDLDDIWGGTGEVVAKPKRAPVPKKHPKMKPVEQWTVGFGKKIARFSSLVEASAITGVTRQNIYGVLIGNHKIAGGYSWRYEESGEI